ncbi:MAG: AraC family transcriptional regulator [Verrucomicrobiales bacterium]|jgi:AraC-like DNA-binding protein|nr:AraC family transcriptional regulator [Verrucomicrobiales bacterium]
MSKNPAKRNKPGRKKLAQLLQYPVFKMGRNSLQWFMPLHAPNSPELCGGKVQAAGYSIAHPPYEIVRVKPPYHVMLFLFMGKVKLSSLYHTHTVLPGEPWLMPAGSSYRYESRELTAMVWFHFRGESLPCYHGLKEPKRLAWEKNNALDMRFYMEKLRRLEHSTGIGAEEIRRRIYEILNYELGAVSQASIHNNQSAVILRLQEIWDEFEKNPNHYRLDINELIQKSKLSRSRFYSLCINQLGFTPYEKITKLRMNHAMSLLHLSNEKIETIAQELGYSNLFAFSKAFKKTVGISPKKFRVHPLRQNLLPEKTA